MLIMGALAALSVAEAAASSFDSAVVTASHEDHCCRLVINVRKDEIPCLLDQLRRLEAADIEDAAALQRMLSEKAEACRKAKK